MVWQKIEKAKKSTVGRKPTMTPSISRSTKKKDIGHLTVPISEAGGFSNFDVFVDGGGNVGFSFAATGEYRIQSIRTNPNMVRLNIPKQLLRDCPPGTRKVDLRYEEGLLVLDASYFKASQDEGVHD